MMQQRSAAPHDLRVQSDQTGNAVETAGWHSLAALWCFAVIVGWVMTLIGAVILPWAETTIVGKLFEVFLFKECLGGICRSESSRAAVAEWSTAAAIAIIGLVVLVVTIATLLGAACGRSSWIKSARVTALVGSVLLMVAWIFISIGFRALGTVFEVECAEVQGPGCAWTVGTGLWVMFTGSTVIFLASVISVPLFMPSRPMRSRAD